MKDTTQQSQTTKRQYNKLAKVTMMMVQNPAPFPVLFHVFQVECRILGNDSTQANIALPISKVAQL
jgi:hypothetical protein